ncbi:MAG: ABC transporter ATP-binding protein, partial [Pseudomonadota bacterium]
FEDVTVGDIRMADVSVRSMPAHKRGMGMVFQNYALFPHMSVAQNVAFPLEVRGIGKSDRGKMVDRALAMMRLTDFADRRPAQLSGGQQQRAALARALVFEPKLVLMDEPLGALDRQLREQMQIEIQQVARSLAVTVVYVTHDQHEAMAMSDRVAVFDKGTVQQLGTPREIYDRPANPFVAQFIGENNELAATIIKNDAGRAAATFEDGSRVVLDHVTGARPGDTVRVFVRPERVTFDTQRLGEGSNRYRAEVLETLYMGDTIRTRLGFGGGDGFWVKSNENAQDTPWRVGAIVDFGWLPGDCRAFASLEI